MEFKNNNRRYFIKLTTGEEIIAALTDFASQQKITAAAFFGIGAVSSVELGFFDQNKQGYHFKKFDQPLEITNLTGNVTIVNDKPFLHVHGVFGDANFQTIAGHIKTATVGPTCEIFLISSDIKLPRTLDQATGLKLLDLK